ncbi:MAG: EamA family transporter, partial [Verrucomicrobia bacterium]|nr:EamA family transporter [Verrucomicrobiota bacterium]
PFRGQAVHSFGVGLGSFADGRQRHWPVSQVFLFSNLIPASTMVWAWLLLGEPVTQTFWVAMVLVIAGVVLGQWRWRPSANEPSPTPNE